jgi:hypothetical protein
LPDALWKGSIRPRLRKNFRASLFRSLLRGLRAFRVDKIAKNLALLGRLQNFAEFLHGLDPKRKLPSAQGLTARDTKAEVPFSATVVATSNRLRDCAEK